MDLRELAAQLRKPEGPLGKQVAEMMNKGNFLLNQWVMDTMQLMEGDSVLEIGMGNGIFIKDILSKHPSIIYTGIDYSSLMKEEAMALNKQFITNNRASFYTGFSSALPFAENSFTKIMAVNTIYFWENARKELSELKRVLIPGGRVVFGIRSKKTMEQMPFTEYGFTKYDAAEIVLMLESNGLSISNVDERSEPAYEFNGRLMQMENIIVTCNLKI